LVQNYINKKTYAYRNGVLFNNSNLIGTPVFPSTNNVKYIGAYSPSYDRITDGSLDEVRIYNRGSSAEEAMGRYNKTKGRYE
jgi:hypothetical protein